MRRLDRDHFLNDLLAIEAVGIANHEYYKDTYERFRARVEKDQLPLEPKPRSRVIDAASVDASNFFHGMFGGLVG